MSNVTITLESILGGIIAGSVLVAFSLENAAFLPTWAKILLHALLIATMVFELLYPFSKREDEYFAKNKEHIKKAIGAGSLAAFGCSAGVLYILYDQKSTSAWIKAVALGILIGFYIYQMLIMFNKQSDDI